MMGEQTYSIYFIYKQYKSITEKYSKTFPWGHNKNPINIDNLVDNLKINFKAQLRL